MHDNPILPKWASKGVALDESRIPIILVDPDEMYPAYFEEMGMKIEDNLTQYWLEVFYQFMKMDLQIAMGGFAFEIRFKPSNMDAKERWCHKGKPPGQCMEASNKDMDPVAAATGGKEARNHFRKLRGFVPS